MQVNNKGIDLRENTRSELKEWKTKRRGSHTHANNKKKKKKIHNSWDCLGSLCPTLCYSCMGSHVHRFSDKSVNVAHSRSKEQLTELTSDANLTLLLRMDGFAFDM